MRLILLLPAIGLLAACQEQAEVQPRDNSSERRSTTAVLIENAAPPTREAALKLMHERHERMEDIGDATKVLGREVKRDQPDLAAVRSAAAVIHTLAPQVRTWFPAGTGPDVGKTHALPAIWQKPDDFAAKARQFRGAAAAMDEAAKSGDTARIKATFGDLGKSCKACHDPYRAKDDD